MLINVSSLKRALGERRKLHLEKELSPLDIKGDVVDFIQPVKVSLEITNAGSYFEVKGEINTVVKLNCGRCLESYDHEITTELKENYYSAEIQRIPSTDDENEEEYIPFSGDYINIETEVSSSIQLALPMGQICNEQCRGLCPKCGANLNKEECSCDNDDVDPRLAVLQDLLKKKS